MDVRALRKKAGLTQLELARRSHIGRVRISFFECQYVKPTSREELAIHRALLSAAEERAEALKELARQHALELAG
jgi:transcriptional regulator with XRE-family HTH domain